MTDYRLAPEVREVAERLIEAYHEELESSAPRIEYLMTRPSGAGKSGSVPNWKMRKIAGVHAFLATAPERVPERFGTPAIAFFVVEVSSSWWVLLTPEQQQGFVDHVLSHLVYDHEKGDWSIRPPEFGEFSEVLERHGFWRPGDAFKEFAGTVSEQLSLLPGEAEEQVAASMDPSGAFKEMVSSAGGEVTMSVGAPGE